MPRSPVSAAVTKGAGERTYDATVGSYARGRGRTNTAADNYVWPRANIRGLLLRPARVSIGGIGGGVGGGGHTLRIIYPYLYLFLF